MIFLVPLALAVVSLGVSAAAMRKPRHEATHDETIRHSIAQTAALWAIAFLLLGMYLR